MIDLLLNGGGVAAGCKPPLDLRRLILAHMPTSCLCSYVYVCMLKRFRTHILEQFALIHVLVQRPTLAIVFSVFGWIEIWLGFVPRLPSGGVKMITRHTSQANAAPQFHICYVISLSHAFNVADAGVVDGFKCHCFLSLPLATFRCMYPRMNDNYHFTQRKTIQKSTFNYIVTWMI